MTTWVLVADSSRGRIFRADSPTGPLLEIVTLAHPEGRLHEGNLTADLPGRAFDRYGQGRHVMEEKMSAREQVNIKFAQRIGDFLEDARHRGRFQRLIILGSPGFLGHLSSKLTRATEELVVLKIAKNLAQKTAREIRECLPEKLWTTLAS